MLDDVPFLPLKVIKSLDAPLLNYENYPEWLIGFGTQESVKRYLTFFSRVHKEDGVEVRYAYSLHNALNIYYKVTNRPELHLHHFGPVRKFDVDRDAVFILKRERYVVTKSGEKK